MKSLFLNKTKKNTAWLLCLTFIFNLFFLTPKDVKAQLEVVAPATDLILAGELEEQFVQTGVMMEKLFTEKLSLWESITQTYNAIENTIHNRLIELKEYVLDGLAWTVANVIIDQFGDALVDWIRNGFDGSPMFLNDPEGFFRDTANQLSGAIINDLDMEWLCDPLDKLYLKLDFFFPGTDRAKYQCTFEEIADVFASYADRDDLSDWISIDADLHERNIVREFGSDYRNGGFLMWLLTADEKNNDLGRTLQTANDAYMAASISIGSEKFQLNLYKGFFGVRKCVEYIDILEEGDYILEEEGKNGEPPCAKYETKTPGTLVQDQLDDVGGKDLSRLQVADEIDEIIGALAMTMMGWLLTGGNEEGGVLGYDKDADYSGTNRDHYGELSKNQELTQKKMKISEQVTTIESNEEPYSDSLEDYADALDDTKSELEITLAKLECIRATSTNDTLGAYPDSDCDGADEDTKNILLSALDKTESDITSDIGKTESQIAAVDGEISEFNDKYGANAADTSAQVLELFDEFEGEVMQATKQSEINTLEIEYCYSYDKKNETGEICGVFDEDSADNDMSVHISAERNPAVKDASGLIKTKIYWKALNAESCEPTGGDSDKTWKKTNISTSDSYTTASFEDGESRTYGIKCSDAENTDEPAEVSVSADSSVVPETTGSLFAKETLVKSGDSSSLYWLSTNTSQWCYLYSDQDDFDEEAEYVGDSAENWFKEAGYYLKTNYLNRTSGQETGIISSGETFRYKLICGDFNEDYSILSEQDYSILSELEIAAAEDSDKETHQTHSDKEFKDLNKETVKITTEMDSIALESACLLNDYTQDEDVSQSECAQFEESESPLPEEPEE